jgi:predicted DCC family thiol-disulfide oxidoreductase YuxK
VTDLPDRVILFDGVCAVCNAGMVWILDHDPADTFAYAPLQGSTAAEVRSRHPEIPASIDTLVLVDRSSGRELVLLRSDAILGVLALLPAPWRWARVLRWIPRPLRDFAYDRFAAVRYRLFGKVDRCRLPTEREAARMLA